MPSGSGTLSALPWSRAERDQEAQRYFAENAAHWDEIRSLYTDEADVEAAIVEAAGTGPSSGLSISAPAPGAC